MKNFNLLLIVLIWATFCTRIFSQPDQATITPVTRTDVPHRTNTTKAVAIPLRQPVFNKPNPKKKADDWEISIQYTPLKPHRIPGASPAFDSIQAERIEAKRLQDPGVVVQGNDVQNTADMSVLPVVGNNFAGNAFNGWVPPDNNMAISDAGHIVSVVNSSVMFTDVSGSVYLEQNFDDFLDFLGLSSFYFDPKVLFDPVENKFIMVVLNGNSPGNSTVVIGYSVSENPSDGWWWKLYSGAPTGSNAWFDYPSIGVSGADFYVTGNLFDANDNFVETIIYQFQKAPGFVGADTPGLYWYNITDANSNPDFGLMPVSYGFEGSIGPGIYFLSSQSGGGSSQIMMYYTTNSIGNDPDLEVYAVNDGDIYTAPINGFQMGTSDELRTNDCRMLSGFYGSGIIHFVMNTSVDGYTRINYGRLDPVNLTLEDRAFGLDGYEYAFPSISPFTLDPNDKSVLIGFLRTGSSIYPQFRVVSFDNDWNNSGSVSVKTGESYVDYLGGSTERWGDYSGICRRHNASNVEVWVSGCYGNDFDNWAFNILSTWIAQISDQVASQPPVANFSANQTIITAGQSVTFTDLSTNNPTSRSWSFSGGSPSTSTLATPTVTYNTPGVYSVTLTVSNNAGSDSEIKTNYIVVNAPGGSNQCFAKISPTETREFMCHNLGAANTTADPFTPSWQINGGYWQWGRVAQAAPGPTGSGAGQSNNGAISGWNTTPASPGAWSDASKTTNDPCPLGFRVPTGLQWYGVRTYNIETTVGTWSNSPTNYSSGKKFGNNLMLPTTGSRDRFNGSLDGRGINGYYWSSTEAGLGMAVFMGLSGLGGLADGGSTLSYYGFSVRCISDNSVSGSIGSINCTSASINGALTANQAASGVSASVPYTGGNGGAHSGQTVTSTGVSGLTATLAAGAFANGSGSLLYNITGIPGSSGTASFALNIGGKTCILSITVSGSSSSQCFAKISPTETREFMCHNLGSANTSADPFTPSWEINGGYWQWGRKDQAAPGPTGPGSSQAGDGIITGWNTSDAPDGSWSDNSKTANDPCPSGFRVPTGAQWNEVRFNNTQTDFGTWFQNATNYSSGKKFGDNLFLPAAGERSYWMGSLGYRGEAGYYWSSSKSTFISSAPVALYIGIGQAGGLISTATSGYSIRCISESPLTGFIGIINCSSATTNGALTSNQAASGVSASVPYTGGNGGAHSGQSVASTGVSGLTATLAAGTFANGSGSLLYDITGIPGSSGTASFVLNIGGKTCTLLIPVQANIQPPVANFSANETAITAGQTIQFTDLSTNAPTSWNWAFPGGTPSASTQSNPSVTYNTAGVYNVTLVASNSAGNDSEIKTGYIVVNPAVQPPVANFSANQTTITAGQTIQFTDLSTNAPTSWNWSFPGGSPSSSTLSNPSVTYNTAGVYNVTLVASNSAGNDSEIKTGYIMVNPAVQAPVANFSANQTAITAGQTIQFTDLSTNAPTSWNWSFPGGSPSSSTLSNPSVTYNTAGVYNVTLVASNSAGNDLETKTGYITVSPVAQAPVADFIADETMIPIGGAVNFTDLSMNSPTSWNWSFPGGLPNTSTFQNPIIIYPTGGVYNVTLVSSNAVGSDVETKNGYIKVGTIGTDKLEQEGKIFISPNPVTRGKSLDIQLLLNQPEELEVFVVSGNGSVIKRLVDNRFKIGQTRLSFSTENLSAGYYFLIFQNPDKSFVHYEKFIVLD